jgi:hypothetical protein
MEYICKFIAKNANLRTTEKIGKSILNVDTNQTIDNYSYDIAVLLDIYTIDRYYYNWCIQRATIISFVYKGRRCNIYEHFGSQRDYIGVWMEAI